VSATPDELVGRARERSGLSELGAGGWEEGLAQLVAALPVDLGGDATAIATLEEIIVTRLVHRLRLEEWYAEHGDEAAEPVQGPVVIVGLPRTATTALQFLLANDPQFRFTRPWEVSAVFPPPELATEAHDPRRLAATPRSGVRHIASVDGPIEDGPLLSLHCHGQELGAPLFTYTTWWRTADMMSTFAYYDRVLRFLHSRRPPCRWLVKSPLYLFHLMPMAEQFPNARFIFTHRDPAVAIPSTCSTVLDAWSLVVPSVTVDRTEVGRFVLEHYVVGMQRALAARDKLGEHRFLDVGQQTVQHDPIGTAERIYAFLGLELGDDVRAAMTTFAAENQRGARGEHNYTAEEFGCTTDGIRGAFGNYLDRFGAFAEGDG
jgi:hypothetical protein